MRRREFIAGLGGSVVCPLSARRSKANGCGALACWSARACKSPNLKQTGEVNMTFYGFR
jgi:hypothetical protein